MFSKKIGFCNHCGSILPPIRDHSTTIVCYACAKKFPSKSLIDEEEHATITYTLHFNKLSKMASTTAADTGSSNGRLVDRKCPCCGNDQMAYDTVQLRSADEGQTVFYTCQKCEFKDSENS